MTLHMSPRPTGSHLEDCAPRYSDLCGERYSADPGRANAKNIAAREFCHPVMLAFEDDLPALLPHVLNILALRPVAKVIRVATRRVVATVKDLYVFPDRTIGQNPCNPVCRVHSRGQVERPVVSMFPGPVIGATKPSNPRPALIQTPAIHFAPEAFGDGPLLFPEATTRLGAKRLPFVFRPREVSAALSAHLGKLLFSHDDLLGSCGQGPAGQQPGAVPILYPALRC